MRDGVYQKDLIHLGIRKILEGSDNNDKTFEDLTKCENKSKFLSFCYFYFLIKKIILKQLEENKFTFAMSSEYYSIYLRAVHL